ncbi:MAG: dihydroneopterin aldolase [Bacteroidia bacterium]
MNINKGTGHIQMHNMEFYAFHGVDPIEQKIGRTFKVSVDFNFDFETAAIEDKLEETADYGKIYELAKLEMQVTERLLETVVRRIAWRIKNTFAGAEKIKVSIKKMAPIVGGKVEYATVGYELR